MSKNKSFERKRFLGKKAKQNRRIPIFVIARTARRLVRNTRTRNWRQRKLGVKIK
ncbi:MAG: 50S ribosomal protein L39e [Candidatus Micrarchaeota archaeon]